MPNTIVVRTQGEQDERNKTALKFSLIAFAFIMVVVIIGKNQTLFDFFSNSYFSYGILILLIIYIYLIVTKKKDNNKINKRHGRHVRRKRHRRYRR